MDHPGVVYSRAGEATRGPLVELLRTCDLPTADLPASLEHFILASRDGAVVGCVGLELLEPQGRIGLLRSLAVRAEERGQGIARALFERARQLARALGAGELYLLTTTAEALFRGWGFQALARERAPLAVQGTAQYRDLCPASAVLMQLEIDRAPT